MENANTENRKKSQAGKGSKPRNCFSKKFRDNWSQINWSKKNKKS